MFPNAIRSLPILLVLTVVSCSRAATDSRVRMTLPKETPVFTSKAGVSAQDLSNFCYLVNVTGDGIPTSTPQAPCSPVPGQVSSFSYPGSTIEMTVPRGKSRSVELYGYIPKRGESCSSMGSSFTAVPLNRLFRLGKTENVDMTQDVTNVDVMMQFPGLQNHLGTQDHMPTTCYTGLPEIRWNGSLNNNPATLRSSADTGVAIEEGKTPSTGVKLRGRVSAANPKAKLTSSQGVKLIVR